MECLLHDLERQYLYFGYKEAVQESITGKIIIDIFLIHFFGILNQSPVPIDSI